MDMAAVISSVFLQIFLVVICWNQQADTYKPVVIVHGIFDGPPQMQDLTNFILKVSLVKLPMCRENAMGPIFVTSEFYVNYSSIILALELKLNRQMTDYTP